MTDPNSPPANTFSGWISSLFGGNVGPPSVNSGGGSPSATPSSLPGGVNRGTFGAVTDSSDRLKAVPQVATTTKKPAAVAKKPAALDAHQLHLAHLAHLAATAKPAAKPAPKAVAAPVSHATTAGTAKAKTPAGSAAGNASSPVAGAISTGEIAIIGVLVFVFVVFVAKRKRR